MSGPQKVSHTNAHRFNYLHSATPYILLNAFAVYFIFRCFRVLHLFFFLAWLEVFCVFFCLIFGLQLINASHVAITFTLNSLGKIVATAGLFLQKQLTGKKTKRHRLCMNGPNEDFGNSLCPSACDCGRIRCQS